MRKTFPFFFVLILSGCVSPGRLGISQQQWEGMSPDARSEALNNYAKIKSETGRSQQVLQTAPVLGVYMLRGEAIMPPFTDSYSFETTYFKIAPGACKRVRLQSIDTSHQTALQVCYDGKRLSIDPSRYVPSKAKGSVYIDYNPVWLRGFTYSDINTSGFARLRDTSISVKVIPKN